MKRILKYAACLPLAVLSMTACNKNEDKVTLEGSQENVVLEFSVFCIGCKKYIRRYRGDSRKGYGVLLLVSDALCGLFCIGRYRGFVGQGYEPFQ